MMNFHFKKMKRGAQILPLAALLCSTSLSAREDKVVQGHGIKLGEDARSAVHLNLDFGAGYNTNPYSIEWGKREVTGDMILKVRPGMSFSNNSRIVSMNIGASVDWNARPNITGSQYGRAVWDLFQANIYGNAEFNKDGVLSLYLKDTLNMTRKSQELFLGDALQLNNTATTGFTVRPSALVSIDADGQFGFTYWPPSSDIGSIGNPATTNFNSTSVYGHLRFNWQLASKTNFFIDAKGGQYVFRNDSSVWASPIWAKLGVKSDISPKFSGTLSAGYANPLLQNAATGAFVSSDYLGITFEASGRWQYTDLSSFSFSFTRDMSPVPSFLQVTPLTASLKLDQWIGDKFSFDIGAKVDYSEFGLPLASRSLSPLPPNRHDISFGGDVGLTWHIRKWFAISVSNETDVRWTDSQTLLVSANASSLQGGQPIGLKFVRNESMLMFNLKY